MKKRQMFMLLIAIWLAIISTACRQEIQPVLSVENPVIVDLPWVSRTVFTNWVEIEVVYTVRWLDGYKPLFDQVKPENMSFNPFELDPISGQKLELRDRRKYKKENYQDIIYHLKHIGEKKGDVIISEQVFYYVKEEPGKSLENLETKEFKAPGFLLRYDSVLTNGADDIMDRVDFGSFKRQEYFWKGLSGGLALVFGVVLFLLFRRPVVVAGKISKTKTVFAGQVINEQKERLTPKYALVFLSDKLFRLQLGFAGNPNNLKLHYETRVAICNELRQFFLSFVPCLMEGEFTFREIRDKISLISEKRKRELLVVITKRLEAYEKILYLDLEKIKDGLIDKITPIKMDEIITIRKHVDDLVDWKIWLFNKYQKWRRLVTWLAKLIVWLTKLFRWLITKLFRRAK